MTRDTVTTRRRAKRRLSRSPKPKSSGTSGHVLGFSKKSRNRALLHLRNSTCYRCFIVLTFPKPVNDDKTAKAALDRFALWANRKGVSLFWKLEFREDRPHFHLLATSQLTESEVSRVWADIIGAQYAKVFSRPVENPGAAIRYVIKPCSDPQNMVPKGYRNMGRFWGTRGPDARPEILFEAVGDPSKIAPLQRAVRAVEKAQRRLNGQEPVPDTGRAGRTHYDLGGDTVAKPLQDLANCLRGDRAGNGTL